MYARRYSALYFFLVGQIVPICAETILDDNFDDSTVTGWESIGNILAADHTITEADGELTSAVVGTEANLNTNRGIVSEVSFKPLDDSNGFYMNFEVVRQGDLSPGANGMFLGLTSSNTDFFRDEGVFTFGLVFWGLPARTDSDGGVSLVTNDIGAGGPTENGLILDANPNSIELASFQDGCSVTLAADSIGWSFKIDGINDVEGNPTTMFKSGAWADAGTDYDTVFGEATDWHVLATNQGDPANNTHTVVYDRIALNTGRPPRQAELQITSITTDLDAVEPTVTLQWNAKAGAAYSIEYSTDLVAGFWVEVTDDALAESDQAEFVHNFSLLSPVLIGAEKVFYRVYPSGF
ncbi:hypothetical protein N9042_00430 [bacterium]|nr:hypothetical protein [Akkermansiaceae bacterium]MDB4488214.1 hypothetical protein [bacterium]MDB4542012.1 hypothetical protein [bacterium]